MDAAGSERAAILGTGDGGTMAAMFAATYPDRTTSLILGNSAARLSWAPDYPIGLPAERQSMFIQLVEQTWGTAELMTAINPSLARDPSAQPGAAKALRQAASPATAAAVMRMLFQLDVRPLLPAIRVPTLVMHRRDNEILTMDHGRYLAEHIDGARFVELPGADYLLAIGDVDPVVDEVEEFLTGREQPLTPTACWQRSCSPTSSDRPSGPPSSAISVGGTCSTRTIDSPSGSLHGTEARS